MGYLKSPSLSAEMVATKGENSRINYVGLRSLLHNRIRQDEIGTCFA